MPKRRKKPKRPASSKFKVGDRVRVKPGVTDEDHPDIPLSGWAGTVSEIRRGGMCCVRWSRETLTSIHPIYKKRCAIDGTMFEEYWFEDDDLEADPGGPLSIEQPTAITPRPLSANEQGDRVRMVFGLTSDDFLPDADNDSLETYYDYLVERLSLPMEARYCPEYDFSNPSPVRSVKVVALDREVAWDEDEGVLCLVRTADGEDVVPLIDLELRRSDPNRQLVDDFTAWFVGDLSVDDVDDVDAADDYGDDGADEEDENDEEFDEHDQVVYVKREANWRSVTLMILEIVAFAASFGAVVGTAVAAMQWARWSACITGGVAGVLTAVSQATSPEEDVSVIVSKYRKAYRGMLGLVTGAIQGALFGIMVVAFIGAALGAMLGLVLKRLARGKNFGRFFHIFPGAVMFAAACGVAAQAFYLDRAAATTGLWQGTLIGLAGGLFVCLVCLPLSSLMVRRT